MSLPALAGGDEKCPGLTQRLLASFKNYVKEVKDTRGLRLALRPSKPQDHPNAHLLNILTAYTPPDGKRWYSAPIRDSLQFIPRVVTKGIYGKKHDFTPIRALEELVQRPIELAAVRMAGREWRLGYLLTVPAHLLAFLAVYHQIDEANADALDESVLASIEADKDKWDALLRNDFRFKDIKKRLLKSELTEAQARIETHNRLQMIKSYQIFMRDAYASLTPEEQEAALLQYPMFSHITSFLFSGVPRPDGYRYSDTYSPVLDDSQKGKLIQLAHVLATLQEILPHMVKGGEALQMVEQDPATQAMLRSIQDDSFTKKLQALHRSGKMSQEQLVYRLQEDAFWRIRMVEWTVVGAQKLKAGAPITLENIHEEMLAEIEKR